MTFPRIRLLGPVVLLALVFSWSPAAAASSDSTSFADDPTRGRYMVPRFEVTDPTVSQGELMTLREIIERASEGERTKLAGHSNMTWTETVRVVTLFKKKKIVIDLVNLMFENEKGDRREAGLAESQQVFRLDDGAWELDEDEGEQNLEVHLRSSEAGKGLSRLPFFLEEQSEYDFKLLDRVLEDNHVIFKIGFEPRSPFKPLPSGTVYVDTNRFRIVHEEFSFKESPFPLLVKDIRRVSRHWKELPGGEWVPTKILAELRFHGGWTGVIPEKIEVAAHFDGYSFDLEDEASVLGEAN